jgi:glucose repression mediator protein
MRMEPNFEKANEIYFRLGIIYKQQQKFNQSLDVCINSRILVIKTNILQCFKYIVTNPPRPLTEEDIWFQVGHVYEQQKEVCQTEMTPGQLLTQVTVRSCKGRVPPGP